MPKVPGYQRLPSCLRSDLLKVFQAVLQSSSAAEVSPSRSWRRGCDFSPRAWSAERTNPPTPPPGRTNPPRRFSMRNTVGAVAQTSPLRPFLLEDELRPRNGKQSEALPPSLPPSFFLLLSSSFFLPPSFFLLLSSSFFLPPSIFLLLSSSFLSFSVFHSLPLSLSPSLPFSFPSSPPYPSSMSLFVCLSPSLSLYLLGSLSLSLFL